MGKSRAWPAHDALEARLCHRFSDAALLTLALTHISALPSGAGRVKSNQRLEFLGDRVLGLVVSDLLYRKFPRADEGELSRRLAELVRKETCAEVAVEWQLGPHIRLGEGEIVSGGAEKVAILADACEAIIGAIFLDAGFEAAQKVIAGTWEERVAAATGARRDPKTALQEWAQGRGLAAPTYGQVSRTGPDHAPSFVVAVHVDGFADTQASGASKRAAEQAAAAAFMESVVKI
ncbi:ribonuclease III [Methylovirgula sp. 4M-Z18]|uniref:ribonuclease III n=1 Tax=Methylovirgula sp. 4M-Z18 TaxID=2293567 RepID=UPI000E2FD77E|nr:ribonuclease III [Methylovirgula sp. 4M-Z18]RFB80076.1 ribonuclease III [Methylovirgula sp. 4M-Z18]